MNSLKIGLFTALAATPAIAMNDGTDAWGALDQELASLAKLPTASDSGVKIGAYTAIHYTSSSDAAFGAAPNADVGGWQARAVRLEAKGSVGDYDWKISLDAAKGTFSLKDAYAAWKFSEAASLTWGQYKEPLLHSGLSSSSRQLLVDRTVAGRANDDRELGAMLSGSMEQFDWFLSAQNGADGVIDEHNLTAKAVWNAAGHGFGKYQGAYGSNGETNLAVGLGVQDDGGIENGTKLVAEAGGTYENFSAYLDYVQYDEDYDRMGPGGAFLGMEKDGVFADTSPMSLTVSRIFAEDELEAAVRYEDRDDAADTTAITAGINWYGDHGHNTKWQLAVTSQDSNDPSMDGSKIELGFVWRSK